MPSDSLPTFLVIFLLDQFKALTRPDVTPSHPYTRIDGKPRLFPLSNKITVHEYILCLIKSRNIEEIIILSGWRHLTTD